MKEQKGITLVALIITIIVMLILAGVSISLVVGEGGVLNQARNAGDSTKVAEEKQAIQLACADLVMQYYGNTSDAVNIFTSDKLAAAITANGVAGTTCTGAFGSGIIVTAGSKTYTLTFTQIGSTGAYQLSNIAN